MLNFMGLVRKGRDTNKGFTLVELLVVIAIIGVLATLVLLQLGTARGRARDTKRITDVNQIRSAVEQYFEDNNGQYPPGITDADIGNYMTRVPTDPLTDDPYGYDTDPSFQAFQIVAELENSAAALDNDADLAPADLNGGGVDATATNETCASKTAVDCQYDQGIRL